MIEGKINPSEWEENCKKIRELKKTIESEKTKEDKKLKQETVKDDLKNIKKEIDDLKKELIIAKYKEGVNEDYELTKKEKETYDKKDKPIESYDTINSNLETAKGRYLDIYSKLGFYYKIQGEITLLNEDLARLKELKKSFEAEKAEKDKDLKRISDELFKLSDKVPVTDTTSNSRKDTLISEQSALQIKVKNYSDKIETIKKKEEAYTEYINKLKKIPEKDAEENFKKEITNDYQSSISIKDNVTTITLKAPLIGGSSNLNENNNNSKDYSKTKLRKTHKKYKKSRTHKKAKKTKQFKVRIIKRSTLRKIKKYMRKHNYTL